MDIEKIEKADTGASMRIEEKHNKITSSTVKKGGSKTAFNKVLEKTEKEILEDEKKRKSPAAGKAGYIKGKRVI